MTGRIKFGTSLAVLCAALLVASVGVSGFAQGPAGQGPPPGAGAGNEKADKKNQKKVDKDANKLAEKADHAAKELGRDVVFCILAAHTTGVGTAAELKSRYESLGDFPFGQFVAAVLMADRTEKPLADILSGLQAGKSLGQIAREMKVNMGELRQGFGELRSELARSMTNPPTRDCFATT